MKFVMNIDPIVSPDGAFEIVIKESAEAALQYSTETSKRILLLFTLKNVGVELLILVKTLRRQTCRT